MVGNRNSSDRNMNDGFFDLQFNSTGVYLTVFPPMPGGKKVKTSDIVDRLNRKHIMNYDMNSIEQAVSKEDRLPVKIAEAQEEIMLDASVNVNITPDKMKAFIILTPPDGGKPLEKARILDALRENGVVFGIKTEVLDSLEVNPEYNQLICVAEGQFPVNGQNGTIEFYFDRKKDYKPKILEDGRVDFRELHLIESVKKGQKLCSLLPPKPGQPGKTVLGTDIPAINGKPAVLPRGKNIVQDEEGQSLYAAIDGKVEYTDGKVNVFATFEVAADVDNSTGNINFIGNVIIRGNVLSGFSVEAGGNVEVWGVVEGAYIKASGDIILRRGMQGMGKGVLVSGGNIIARYIENSNIEAKLDIKADAIMHSNVKCGNTLELTGSKGLLVGGICRVGREIKAKVIGSYMATTTEIEVGIDPTIRERYRSAYEEFNTVQSDLKKTEQAITLLKKLEQAGVLTPDKQEMLVKSTRTRVYLNTRIAELSEELVGMQEKLEQDALGKVKVYNFIYPGTKVTIGSSSLYIKENLQYCTLYKDGADIKVGPMDR